MLRLILITEQIQMSKTQLFKIDGKSIKLFFEHVRKKYSPVYQIALKIKTFSKVVILNYEKIMIH